MPSLVLGPMLRYVDDRSATVWVQTDVACEVEILGARARTWCVDGLHFALVAVQGSPDDGDVPYEVRLDGTIVWPQESGALPPSTIRFTDPRRPLDVAFGSCRITRPHVPPYVLRASEHPDGQGVDALRAYALRLAGRGGAAACPDMLLMRGDQIYADEPSPALREQIAARDRAPRTRSPPTSASTPWRTGRRGRTRRSAGCSPRSR